VNWRKNVAFIIAEAVIVAWAHLVGVAWRDLVVLFAGLALAGCAAFAYLMRVHLPRAHRRFEEQLRVALIDNALAEQTQAVEGAFRPALPTSSVPRPLRSDSEAA
jgi:hypothetical protein